MRNVPPGIQTMSVYSAAQERLIEGLSLIIADLYLLGFGE
jgi:hypothetical protein